MTSVSTCAAAPFGGGCGRAGLAWRVLVFVFVALPALFTAWVLLVDYGAFFWDARTLPCGIEAAIATGAPNAYRDPAYPGPCAGYRFAYTAPPGITAMLGGLFQAMGRETLVAAYALLYALALGALGWAARRYHGSLATPVAAAFTVACGAFVFEGASGNLSVVFGGLLTGLVLHMERRPDLAVALCVVAALFKPHFALYLLVPLLGGGSLLSTCFAAAFVSVWYAGDAVLHPQAFADWLGLVLKIVHGESHFGFMKLMELAGYAQGDWVLLASAYALWCAVLVGLTSRLCARLASPVDRAFAALACATLLLPRLKEYDCLVLVPLFFWLSCRSTAAVRRWLVALVGLIAFVVPAAWWWTRKLSLLDRDETLTLRAVAELKWLAQVQGVFLAAALVIVFAVMVATMARHEAVRRADAHRAPAQPA